MPPGKTKSSPKRRKGKSTPGRKLLDQIQPYSAFILSYVPMGTPCRTDENGEEVVGTFHNVLRDDRLTDLELNEFEKVVRKMIKQPDVWTFGFMPLSHHGIPI